MQLALLHGGEGCGLGALAGLLGGLAGLRGGGGGGGLAVRIGAGTQDESHRQGQQEGRQFFRCFHFHSSPLNIC